MPIPDPGNENKGISPLAIQERSRERAVVVCVKYNRFFMKSLQVFIPGKVDEYKDAGLLIVT